MSTGGPSPTYRTLREEQSYAECVRDLGGAEYIDEITGHLRWRLSRDPVSYSFSLEGRETRVTFTEELDGVPVYRVFLQVVSDEVVALLWIEEADDAPPFGFDDWMD